MKPQLQVTVQVTEKNPTAAIFAKSEELTLEKFSMNSNQAKKMFEVK